MKLARVMPWLGGAAAAVLLLNLNVLGARWYQRWDVTSERLYSLSTPTRELLRDLPEPVEVLVLLSKGDPLLVSVRHMLESYGAETPKLRVRYVDPDRSPADFLAVQQKYQILAGKAEDGRVITDAALILAAGPRHWFVTAEELVHMDEDSGLARPALEQALSTALANVRRTDKAKLCFTTGHREPTLDDLGPQGLSELKQRLLKSNYEVESVDGSAPQQAYTGCAAVIVPTPELELGADAAERLKRYVQNGGSALLLLGPTLGEREVRGTGLEPVLELAGVSLSRSVVFEQDEAARLPRGSGELFFAKLLPHAITRGVLHDDDKLSSRVLVVQSRGLTLREGATALMQSSPEALALTDLSVLTDTARRQEAARSAEKKSFTLAAARELARPEGAKLPHGARLFVTGASNLAWNRNFQDPALYGNRRLIENAISWVAARPSMISVPEKRQREVGLSLAEESLGEVMRYVLLYMPAAAGLIGAFVLLRRRSAERAARAHGGGAARERE